MCLVLFVRRQISHNQLYSHYLDMLQRAGFWNLEGSVNGRITGGTKKTFKNLQNLSVVNFKSLRQEYSCLLLMIKYLYLAIYKFNKITNY